MHTGCYEIVTRLGQYFRGHAHAKAGEATCAFLDATYRTSLYGGDDICTYIERLCWYVFVNVIRCEIALNAANSLQMSYGLFRVSLFDLSNIPVR